MDAARNRLPAAVRIVPGDVCEAQIEPGGFDIVMQLTVFSSILDSEFQQRLATRMWSLVRSGGGVLWYDFTFDNPANPDVKGVPLSCVKKLFPEGRTRSWRVTLAPPLARLAARLHPALYSFLSLVPLLRTHRLCWIEKLS